MALRHLPAFAPTPDSFWRNTEGERRCRFMLATSDFQVVNMHLFSHRVS